MSRKQGKQSQKYQYSFKQVVVNIIHQRTALDYRQCLCITTKEITPLFYRIKSEVTVVFHLYFVIWLAESISFAKFM